jgi:SAM-dependent methyltransferase
VDLAPWTPYEAAMLAFHEGDYGASLVVYDDFERDEAPLSYFFRGPDQFPPVEQTALQLCRGRVLDVGAGSGCHSLVLQDRGIQVTAIDALPGLVRIMRARGVRDVRVASWQTLEADPFDTVLLLMNGLGLAETLSGLRRFLNDIRRLLRPGGQVLADSTDVRTRMDPSAGRAGTVMRSDGRYIGELHFQVEFNGRKGDPFPQLYVDPETLAQYAEAEGWSCEIVCQRDKYGNYLARLLPLSS